MSAIIEQIFAHPSKPLYKIFLALTFTSKKMEKTEENLLNATEICASW